MIYYFFASAPLHLINISEFINQNNIRNYKIFINTTKNKRVDSQLLNTIKFLKLKNINKLKWSSFKLKKIFQYQNFIHKIKTNLTSDKIIFVMNDFRNFFFHLIRINFSKSKFILIDDGIITFDIFKKYISRNIYFPIDQYNRTAINLLKIILPSIYKILINSEIKIYSIIGNYIDDKKVIKNNLLFIKKFFNKKLYKKDKSIVFFLGTKLSERGALSLDEELELLNYIKSYWKKRGKKLIYISKRSSSKKKLLLIKNKLLINFIDFNLPIEISLGVEFKKIPYAICSLGSTADLTLKKIYNIKTFIFNPQKYEKKIHLNNFNNYFFELYSEVINF